MSLEAENGRDPGVESVAKLEQVIDAVANS